MGRGGSDTTAVALAAALSAEVCEIYTDVDGVFTADPRIVPNARRLDFISYEEMLELAAMRRQDLAPAVCRVCAKVQCADSRAVVVQRATGNVGGRDISDIPGTKETLVEQPIISGVAHDRSEAKVTVVGVPDKPGEAAMIFETLAESEVHIDMIVQNISASGHRTTDISFTLPKSDAQKAIAALDQAKPSIGFDSLQYDDQIGKMSLVGASMRTHPGVSAMFFRALRTLASTPR